MQSTWATQVNTTSQQDFLGSNGVHIAAIQDTRLPKEHYPKFRNAFEEIGYKVHFTGGDAQHGCATTRPTAGAIWTTAGLIRTGAGSTDIF